MSARGYGGQLMVDTSAWTRAVDGRLDGASRRRFERALVAGQLWLCPPALLELRFSARDEREFAAMTREFDALPHAPLTADAAASAVQAQAELAATPGASHPVKPVDLLIAAIAAAEGIGVLHYDRDYDAIAEHTTLGFESAWVAPRGSID